MSRNTTPTVGARLVRSESFTVPLTASVSPEVKGGRAEVSLHEDFTSQGYKTGYESIPTRWVRGVSWKPDGKVFMTTGNRFTGKRYDLAEQHYRDMVEGLRRQGAVPEQLSILVEGVQS